MATIPPDTTQTEKIPDNKALATLAPDAVMGFTSAASFALLQRAATLLAASTLVPNEYRGNLPNCVIALNMASRIGADPLMVMQNLYIVHGHPGWSSQFLIATFNQCGRFTALRYEWVGERGTDSWGCRAVAIEKSTGEKLVGSAVTIDMAKKEGWWDRRDKNGKVSSKWPNMTDHMLMFRSAAFFIRTYAPELAMGLPTADEIQDTVIEAVKVGAGTYAPVTEQPPALMAGSKLDALAAALKGNGEAAGVVTMEAEPPVTDDKGQIVIPS